MCRLRGVVLVVAVALGVCRPVPPGGYKWCSITIESEMSNLTSFGCWDEFEFWDDDFCSFRTYTYIGVCKWVVVSKSQ